MRLNPRRFVPGVAGAMGCAGLLVFAAGDARAAVTVTLANSDASDLQVSRFDVDGHALDAHDGTLVMFGETYYLYGTSYDCGYQYRQNSKFCGFKVYASPDLVHWTDRGFVVPPADCPYCFRPHVIFNAATSTYVMWSDAGGAYHVYTSSSPTGPFARRADPQLAVGRAVDESLFVDDDGKAYLIHNTTQVAPTLTADMVVEPLTSDFLATTGASVRLGLGDVEAFAVFKRNGTYHALMSDPTCAYCSGATGEMTSTSMMGPWSGAWNDPNGVDQSGRSEPRMRARIVNANNCGGQPLAVLPVPQADGSTAYLFVSDRWNNRAPNESLANFYLGPLPFDANGALAPFSCARSFTISLAVGSAGTYNVSPRQDQTSGFEGFHHYCDIQGNVERQQTFTPSRSGTLGTATITIFRSGEPSAPLVVDLIDADGTVLQTTTLEPSEVTWAPRVAALHPGVRVSAGRSYGLRLRSSTTVGCYGFEYNDTDVYAGGAESLSTNQGVSFVVEPARDLKFTVDVDGEMPGDAGADAWSDARGDEGGSTIDAGIVDVHGSDWQGRDAAWVDVFEGGDRDAQQVDGSSDAGLAAEDAAAIRSGAPGDGCSCRSVAPARSRRNPNAAIFCTAFLMVARTLKRRLRRSPIT
jgi:hypothetical protein